MLFKVLDDVGLFSRHECWVINSFFDLPDFLKKSSPDKADVYKEIAWWEWITCGTWLPARTQPNIVSYAVGEPRVPLRQPCFITSLNTSTPKSMSTWSSLPNSRSESCSPDKCFQLGCAEILYVRRSHVILGTTMAATEISLLREQAEDTEKKAIYWDC